MSVHAKRREILREEKSKEELQPVGDFGSATSAIGTLHVASYEAVPSGGDASQVMSRPNFTQTYRCVEGCEFENDGEAYLVHVAKHPTHHPFPLLLAE
jgi:hypothetical protein